MKRQTRNIFFWENGILVKRLSLLTCFGALFLISVPFQTRATSVLDSKHNLSAVGPGTIKASTEREVCIFCHTPHRAGADQPLWNHQTSTAVYTPYSSPTLIAKVGQPNGASKLCLSCHDGTVAMGMLNSQSTPIAMQNGVTVMPQGPTNVGTDLSQDHPVSFTYDAALAAANGHLQDPTTLTNQVRLDHNGQMQCTACHDPHNNQYGNFLVMSPTGSTLCTTCHINSQWAASKHSTSVTPLTSTATAMLAGRSPSTSKSARSAPKTIAANGCNNCHSTHKAGGRKQLLHNVREEQTCFACHNGTVVGMNIVAEFNKFSAHPVLQSSNLHQAGEDPVNAPRHAACSDCHNSHAVKSAKSRVLNNPNALNAAPSGALLGIKGVNRSGAAVNAITHEYELCFRCHGDSLAGKPATVNRVVSDPGARQQFNPANSSFHPVVAIGRNSNVPSLITQYTAVSTINCTDCHNNDQGPGAGGAGPNGPHGSAFSPLLERRLITTDHTAESTANYALCYKCHSRDSILGDQSFRAYGSTGQPRGHRFHIVDQQTACTTCHDSHGVSKNKHLINFNPDYVSAASNGRIDYQSTGLQSGNCTLTCHGFNHSSTAYPNPLVASPFRKSRGR